MVVGGASITGATVLSSTVGLVGDTLVVVGGASSGLVGGIAVWSALAVAS